VDTRPTIHGRQVLIHVQNSTCRDEKYYLLKIYIIIFPLRLIVLRWYTVLSHASLMYRFLDQAAPEGAICWYSRLRCTRLEGSMHGFGVNDRREYALPDELTRTLSKNTSATLKNWTHIPTTVRKAIFLPWNDGFFVQILKPMSDFIDPLGNYKGRH